MPEKSLNQLYSNDGSQNTVSSFRLPNFTTILHHFNMEYYFTLEPAAGCTIKPVILNTETIHNTDLLFSLSQVILLGYPVKCSQVRFPILCEVSVSGKKKALKCQ